MVRNLGEMMYLYIVINSCLWIIAQKCTPGPAEASKLSLDGPCDPLTGPGQHQDEPDVLEQGADVVFFMLSNFYYNDFFLKCIISLPKAKNGISLYYGYAAF